MERLCGIKGTKDILPEEIAIWRFIEDRSRSMFEMYGFRELRTPIIEPAELFVRGVGEWTDIVQKEMFVFSDRGERKVALRPEATAPAARAYIEHGLHKQGGLAKFYYIGPMFRGERPQAGRQRQFHQLGVEAIGSDSPYLDAEAIHLLSELLTTLGAKGFCIQLNNIGCHKDKPIIVSNLKKELIPFKKKFCNDCQQRIERNIFRIIDCKNEGCKTLLKRDIFGKRESVFPVCAECENHFEKVKDILNSANITYEINPFMARGIDYYTRTIFEITHNSLGAQDALGAGGRYDTLIKDLGGEDTGAIGWSVGIERLIMVLGKTIPSAKLDFYISCLGDGSLGLGFKLLSRLRKMNIPSDMDYSSRGLKAQLKTANRLAARWTGILGDDEVSKGVLTVRDMHTGEQTTVKIDKFEEEIKNKILNIKNQISK